MDPQEELQRLREHACTLEDTVKDLDYQIERAMHAVAAGTDDVGHAMMVLTERRNTQLGFMFDLGKVTAQIEDLENRVREQGERDREDQAIQAWERELTAKHVDYLDWLPPVGDRPHDRDVRNPLVEGEDRMLDDMHREDREPEDYLDWTTQRR